MQPTVFTTYLLWLAASVISVELLSCQ